MDNPPMWDTMLFTPTTGFKDNNQTSYVIVYKASPHNAIVLDHLRPISVHRAPTITSIINEKTSNTEQRAHKITPKLRRCLFKDSHLHRSFEEFYNIQLVSRSRRLKGSAWHRVCFVLALHVPVWGGLWWPHGPGVGSLPGIFGLRSPCHWRMGTHNQITMCAKDHIHVYEMWQ